MDEDYSHFRRILTESFLQICFLVIYLINIQNIYLGTFWKINVLTIVYLEFKFI